MIVFLLILFSVSILGMAIIVFRHLPNALQQEEGNLLSDGRRTGILIAKLSTAGDIIGREISAKLMPKIITIISGFILKIERLTISASTYLRNVRRSLRNRNVSPRESIYWKQLSHWKKNDVSAADDTKEDKIL